MLFLVRIAPYKKLPFQPSLLALEKAHGISSLATASHPHITRRYVSREEAATSSICDAVVQVFRNAVEVGGNFGVSLFETLLMLSFP